jgi:hypothetical protein
MLLIVTYSREARNSLRNVCRSHETATVRRFGRAALLRWTELGAFLALRLREKHGGDVQVERTRPLNEFTEVPTAVREAASAYQSRENPSTPYAKFVVGTPHPDAAAMQGQEL